MNNNNNNNNKKKITKITKSLTTLMKELKTT